MKDKRQLSNAEIASFCSQMALLFQAGITPVKGLTILLSDVQSDSGKKVLNDILEVCRIGNPFHEGLSAAAVFPQYVLHTVKLGEESGNLDNCMLSLANYYEKEENIADSIKNAVTYPFIMIIMMLAVIFVLVSRVMPIFNQVFIELGSEMTGFAASLLSLGNNLNRYSLLLLILICVLLAFYFLATRTSTGKKLSGKLFNIFPPTRSFYSSVASERFARGMALALTSGMDTYESLDLISNLVGNKIMQEKITVCKQQLIEGANFSEALCSSNIFNNLYSQMVEVGFKSGNIDVVLSKIADSYEKNTDRKIQSIISVLEPTLVIILSIIVGLILLSVILPLMGIMASIG